MLRTILIVMAVALSGGSWASETTFDHEAHDVNMENKDCVVCHVEGAYSIIPEKRACLECHEKEFADGVNFKAQTTHDPLWAFSHRAAAKSDKYNCYDCHGQADCLECHQAGFADEQGAFGNGLANVHRGDFQVSHPMAARTDPQLCGSCHETKFCNECHDAFNRNDLAVDSHRRGWSDISVSGTKHSQFKENQCDSCHAGSVFTSHQWQRNHAREARKNLATCQACHPDGDVCITCHSARSGLGINPHPRDWDDVKDNLNKASGGRSCRKCH